MQRVMLSSTTSSTTETIGVALELPSICIGPWFNEGETGSGDGSVGDGLGGGGIP